MYCYMNLVKNWHRIQLGTWLILKAAMEEWCYLIHSVKGHCCLIIIVHYSAVCCYISYQKAYNRPIFVLLLNVTMLFRNAIVNWRIMTASQSTLEYLFMFIVMIQHVSILWIKTYKRMKLSLYSSPFLSCLAVKRRSTDYNEMLILLTRCQ